MLRALRKMVFVGLLLTAAPSLTAALTGTTFTSTTNTAAAKPPAAPATVTTPMPPTTPPAQPIVTAPSTQPAAGSSNSGTPQPTGVGNRCVGTVKEKDGKVDRYGEDVTIGLDPKTGKPVITSIKVDEHLKAGTCKTTVKDPYGNSLPTNYVGAGSSAAYGAGSAYRAISTGANMATLLLNAWNNLDTAILNSSFSGENSYSMPTYQPSSPAEPTEPAESPEHNYDTLVDLANTDEQPDSAPQPAEALYQQAAGSPLETISENNDLSDNAETLGDFRTPAWQADQQTLRDQILGGYANDTLSANSTFGADNSDGGEQGASPTAVPLAAATIDPFNFSLMPVTDVGGWAYGTELRQAQYDAATTQAQMATPPMPCDESCMTMLAGLPARLAAMEKNIRGIYVALEQADFTPGGSWALPSVLGASSAQPAASSPARPAPAQPQTPASPAPTPAASGATPEASLPDSITQDGDVFTKTTDSRGYPEFCNAKGTCIYASQAPQPQEIAQASPPAPLSGAGASAPPAYEPGASAPQASNVENSILALLRMLWEKIVALFTAPAATTLPSTCSLFTSFIGGCTYH